MHFDRAWALVAAPVLLAWAMWEWRRTPRRAALAIKTLSLVAIVGALSEPHITLPSSRVALAVLVDTSASVSPSDLERAGKLAAAMDASRGGHWMRVIPFARTTRAATADELGKSWRLQPASRELGRGTDLEGAVREAISALPPGMNPRVALITDGLENQGSIARAAWQAQQLAVPVDTFALAGRTKPSVTLESLRLPAQAFTGETFAIDLDLTTLKSASAEIELSAENHVLGRTRVMLGAGSNPVRLHTSLNAPGLIELSLAIRSGGEAAETRVGASVMLRRPKALYLSGDPSAMDTHFPATLKAAQFDVQTAETVKDIPWSDYQLVVFNNWELDKVPPATKDEIEDYVKNGGGLLVIGGERNVYPQTRKPEDALERVLPAKLLPPRTSEGRAVVLVIDRSTSMLGPKIDFARLAAIGVVANLRPIDMVGVLVFDTTWLWEVPIRIADDRAGINWLISNITANGGTRIAPALAEGYRAILETDAIYKHIVLLTDGLSDEGNSMNLAREAQNNAITISTVGLGLDVNRSYLTRLAALAGGKSYLMNNPQGLEQIVISDVMEHTGSTAVEQEFEPKVLKPAEILDGVEMAKAPALKGYIRFETKKNAETILRAGSSLDPLLSRWQYGLGRAAVFTSDAKQRWGANWIGWSGYDKFWSNVARDLLPHRDDRSATLEFDSAGGDLIATYRQPAASGKPVSAFVNASERKPDAPRESSGGSANSRLRKTAAPANRPVTIPPVYVLGPDKLREELPVQHSSPGIYEGRIHIGDRQGFFRVRPVDDSVMFPEMSLYRPEAELHDFGSNERLLRQVSQFTGGRFEPDPRRIFDPDGRQVALDVPLWPWLLCVGIALSLAELVMRKWKGFRGVA